MATEAKYRDDKDLIFLQFSDWQDLELLANALICDSEGKEQWTGGLKKTLLKNSKMYPESKELLFKNSWKAIASEIQLFGGDTFINMFRKQGVTYHEIIRDVAEKVGVDFRKDLAVNEIEEKILRKLFGQVTTLEDLPEINSKLKDLGLLGFSSLFDSPIETIKNGVGGSTSSAGNIFAGLNFITKTIKVNPLIALVTAPATAADISAPAYRVTIPAVCIIAMLRNKFEVNKEQFNEF